MRMHSIRKRGLRPKFRGVPNNKDWAAKDKPVKKSLREEPGGGSSFMPERPRN